MKNCALQGPFYDVVIQRGPGLAEEQRQGLPVPQQIADRLAEPGVGLRPRRSANCTSSQSVQLSITGALRS